MKGLPNWWASGPPARYDPSTKVNIEVPNVPIKAIKQGGELYLSRADLTTWMTYFAESMDKGGASWIASDAVRGVRDLIKNFGEQNA